MLTREYARFALSGYLVLITILITACDDDCAEIESKASALYEEAAACTENDDCILTSMREISGVSPGCLGYHCSLSFNANSDLETLGAKFRQLIDDYRGCTSGCDVMPGCDTPENYHGACNTAIGQCRVVKNQ